PRLGPHRPLLANQRIVLAVDGEQVLEALGRRAETRRLAGEALVRAAVGVLESARNEVPACAEVVVDERARDACLLSDVAHAQADRAASGDDAARGREDLFSALVRARHGVQALGDGAVKPLPGRLSRARREARLLSRESSLAACEGAARSAQRAG